MKKKNTFILLLVLLFISILSIIFLGFFKKLTICRNEFNKINYQSCFKDYARDYESYFVDYGEYPISYEQMVKSIYKSTEETFKEYYLDLLYTDFMSNQKQKLIYYPVYDKTTKKRLSYVILSAGIDGKINNILSENDSLFIDDLSMKLKLYNQNKVLLEKNTVKYYYPLYSKKIKKQSSYTLEVNKHENKITYPTYGDSLYIENFKEKLNIDFNNNTSSSINMKTDSDNGFTLFNYLFGEKDFLLYLGKKIIVYEVR